MIIMLIITFWMVVFGYVLLGIAALLALGLGLIQLALSCCIIGLPIAWFGFFLTVGFLLAGITIGVLAFPITLPLAPLYLGCICALGEILSVFTVGLLPIITFVMILPALCVYITFLVGGIISIPIGGMISLPAMCCCVMLSIVGIIALFLVFLAVTYVVGLAFWVVFCCIPCSLTTAISPLVVLCMGWLLLLCGWAITGGICCCATILCAVATLVGGLIVTYCGGPICISSVCWVPPAAIATCCLAAIVVICLLVVASVFLCPMAGAAGAERAAGRYYEVVRPAIEERRLGEV